MNELTTYRWSLEEDIQRYQQAGYEGIGVWRQKLEDYGEERGVDLLVESGLKVTNLMWAGGFTGNDGRRLTECIDDAVHAIRLAAALNAGCLVIYAGGRNNHTYRNAEKLLRGALDELLREAEDAEVDLALEPMHPACAGDWTFLSDLESTIALIDSYDSPHLKLVFDAYHFGHDRSVMANLEELAPYVGVVHLSDFNEPHSIDTNRCPLGEGRVEIDTLVQGLLEAGYEGDFDVELRGSEIHPSRYQELLTGSRRCFESACASYVGS
ncbi:fructoselysine 3-epimerase [Adhaeretor mobilis]|uniref:Fructoselysine 3-epimerase n=2 Tax=Adhaeretor mobilis TaxID=1930276 RepID=A0A517MY83_9BACT|nr:fructoselysine 3-epimerase [Adhaeretor mobilis]